EVESAERIPTGEKGIGRFAADKLGGRLDVFTKTKHAKDGLHLAVDWKDFDDKRKRFNQVEATYRSAPVPGISVSGSGTVLEIHDLRSRWDSARIDSLRTDLGDLLSPFATPKRFTIALEIANSRGTDLSAVTPVRPEADW